MTIYGYCRVSTAKQEDNTSLEEQATLILERYPNAVIVKEVYTGYKLDRPRFQEMLAQARAGDMVVITKLDRFCRNVKEGLKYLDELKERGITIHILNMGIIDDTPMGNLLTTFLLAIAEFERAQITERCQGGRARKRMTDPNYVDGRKKKKLDENKVLREYGMVKLGYETKSDMARHLHICRATLYTILKEHPEYDTYEYYVEDENE